ncbi:MAG TPA: thiamine pyrophosphate-dependent enzyme, partial [Desulfopila sp.]|nr:thiamine pyrophosphate-dependent enzyme [Desulfopila sp.]
VVMTFFGDGATSEGDFHEGLNCAAVYRSPVIFVCQNNHWAISVPLKKQMKTETIAQKAIAYGMPGIQVDGNDVLAVYAAAAEAVERARSGGGPTLIECVTYRVMMHTTADDPGRYRTEEEVKAWEKKDPLTRFARYLEKKGVLEQESTERMEAEVKEQIQQAVESAERRMKEIGDPRDMFAHLYAESPPYLQRQKQELEHSLGDTGEEVDDG